jgi:hypothetical protein
VPTLSTATNPSEEPIFQASEDVPAAPAEVTLAREERPFLVRMSVATEARWLVDLLETLLAAYAATPGGAYRDEDRIAAEDMAESSSLERALASARLPPLVGDCRRRRIDEATARVIVDVFESHPSHRSRHAVLLAMQAPKTPMRVKRMLASWLLEQFPKFENRRHRGQMSIVLDDFVSAPHADRVASMIADERLGSSRGYLLSVLAKTKAPDRAAVIASYLQGPLVRPALLALKMLGAAAQSHGESVEALTASRDPEVRRLAKATLKRIVPSPRRVAKPQHLVGGASRPPDSHVEWSTNLELDELAPAICALGRALDAGLGPAEAAEVEGVAENMKLDQTKHFRFPVAYQGAAAEIWLAVFLDDVDSPDLYIHAPRPIVERMAVLWSASKELERQG